MAQYLFLPCPINYLFFMKNKGNAILLRDGNELSMWQTAAPSVVAPKPEESGLISYDCLIVGAGITGLTAGLILQRAGKKTIIAEANSIGFGTTSGTSAHINTFADTTYKEAESAFGEDGAKDFANAINEGFAIIKENIREFRIRCDFEKKEGYVYAEDEDQAKQLNDIYDGAVKVGVPVVYIDKFSFPVPFQKVVKLAGQAQFHPIKYLQALLHQYLQAGGTLSEKTFIDQLTTEDGIHTAYAAGKTIKAKQVIYATHVPPGWNAFNFLCAPYRSYVMAIKLKSGAYPNVLVYDMQEPYHYFRSHVVDDEQLLLVGGNDHKTGHEDPEKAFESLEKYVRKYFNVSSIKYKWSSQYYIPVDGLPYIGQMPLTAKGIYCATGFNGNGMMLGSVAGKILSDLVCGKKSPYQSLFDPCRVKPIDGFKEFVSENADAAYHFIADRFHIHETDSIKRITHRTGKVVEVDGQKIAVYRDEDGGIHALSPICTHAKCVVAWNHEEKSWDCPCHGARYDIDGKILNGPALRPLENIELPEALLKS